MEDLARLSLVSRIAVELKNHWGIEDKDLSEFIIHLGQESKHLEEFQLKLEKSGAEASTAFCETLFRIIRKLSVKSHGKHHEKRENQDALCKLDHSVEETLTRTGNAIQNEPFHPILDEKKDKYPGLCVPNSNAQKPELHFEPLDAHQPLSQHALDLLEAEKTEFEKRKEEREKEKKGHRKRERDDVDERDTHSRHSREKGASKAFQRQKLVLNEIYDGTVSRVMDYGAFVSFETTEGRKEGLVHASDMSRTESRVLNVAGLVKRNQEVKVKVIALAGKKISLSMRDVDQLSGEDLRPKSKSNDLSFDSDTQNGNWRDRAFNPPCPNLTKTMKYGEITGIKLEDEAKSRKINLNRKRNVIGDKERWDRGQLKASGAISSVAFNDEDSTFFLDAEEDVEDVEVEVIDNEPAFLKGQTAKAGIQLSPIRIVANPDGTLARGVSTSSALAKERHELRAAQESAFYDSIPKDMSRPWEDPRPEPGERTIAQALRDVGQSAYELPQWKKMSIGKSVSFGQKSSKSITEQRESLPIYKLKEDLLDAIRDNRTLIVIGETGSGKTTQMTQYMAEAGYCARGIIGCTQPRRVAAMSVAKRVAEEFGCRLGQEVGYAIRFEDCTSQDTIIKYMTDGMLLREALIDSELRNYSVIMLDEAHERTVPTDVLFSLLKRCVMRRNDFKLIVTSATLDAEKFSDYFFNSNIFTIPGRTFPVEILYTKEPETDYVEAALRCVLQIHLCEPPGDILLFLTGQEEIDSACQTLHDRMKHLENMSPPPLIILPVYSALPSEMQTMIFDPAPSGCRKCVVATNIAEASLTIDGIYFVIDPGFAKLKVYNSKTLMDSLMVSPISQANARQRAGRAGRTGPGKCYRIYTEQAYKTEMLPSAVPEIQRTNLANTVLLLKAMGINNLLNFDFMDPPPAQTLIHALETLYELGALDDEGLLTALGHKMAEFPIEPNLSKMILAAVDLKCSDEIITVVSMLSVQNVFYRPKDKQTIADQKKYKFHQSEGDHITYLEVYLAWQRNRFSNPWCYENFIQARALRRAQEVRKQLITIMDRSHFEITSSGRDYDRVRKAICAGYFKHACKRDPQEGYRTLSDHQQVYMHPSSSLYNQNPEWIVYHELVMTTKEYMRDCTRIEPHWLWELAPTIYQKASDSKLSKRKQHEKIEPLYNRYEEPNAWRLSKRRA